MITILTVGFQLSALAAAEASTTATIGGLRAAGLPSYGLSGTGWSAAIAAGVAVALLLPGRPGPRRLVTPRGLSAVWRPWSADSGSATGRPGKWPALVSIPVRRGGREVSVSTRRRHRLAAAMAAAALLLLMGIPWGLLPASGAFLALPIFLSRLEPAAARRRSARIVADLPLAVDLLAACLRAGRPPDDAVDAVSSALGGPLADLLVEVGRRLSLGADPIDAWACLLGEPACASFARAVQRALRSGAPLAKTLELLADDVRQARRWGAEEQARAVETRSVVPAGLCFLPAFVLLGIVPTIAGSLSGILTFVGD